MSDQEFQLAVIAIVFGSAVAVTAVIIIGMLINSLIKRKSKSDITDNEEFMEALRQFKQKTDRRLSNLEEILADEGLDEKKTTQKSLSSTSKDANQKSIEFNPEEEKVDNQSSKESGGNLKNMLKD